MRGPKDQANDTFLYGTPRRRSRRRGVWLRVKELPNDLLHYFESKMRHGEVLSHVVVAQIKWDGVVLEAWCADPAKFKIEEPVWTVVQARVPEDPGWVCEKNLGAGWRDANYYGVDEAPPQGE